MKINFIPLVIGLLLLVGCKEEYAETRFRVSQFLYSNMEINIEISQKGEVKFKENLRYGETLPYNKLPPGLYTIKFILDNKPLISQQIGFGRGDSYTFILFGLPLAQQNINETNLNTILQKITDGVEAVSVNGYLPQVKILNDAFQGNGKQAKLRWVHITPGANAISAKIIHNKSDTTSFESLSYPNTSSIETNQTGNTKISWYIGSEK